MALTRKEKEGLMELYSKCLEGAKNVIVLNQHAIPVGESTNVRKELAGIDGKLLVAKKRIFLKIAESKGLEKVDLEKLDKSVIMLFSYGDEFAPLKVIAKYKKLWKKAEANYSFEYLGGWFDNAWKDANFVSELANLPSKAELVGKFMFMMNYPVQSFVTVLDKIREKKSS